MECVQSGISELRSTLAARSSDADGRVMSDYLKENLKGEPKCYDLTEFESAYGTIQDNPATREKRGFGSCHERVKRATPDVHCEYD